MQTVALNKGSLKHTVTAEQKKLNTLKKRLLVADLQKGLDDLESGKNELFDVEKMIASREAKHRKVTHA